jgi:hypothetical protein
LATYPTIWEFVLKRLLLVPAILVLGALVAPAGAATAASKPCVGKLKASGHHPKADKLWPITVTCKTASGKPVRATATYQFIYEGQVVATRYPSPNADPDSKCSRAGTCRKSPYPFKGTLRDKTFTWPKRAVGIPLKLRVVLRVKGKGTLNLDYAVTVRR